MAILRGVDCRLFYSTSGITGSFTEATSVREVTTTESATQQDTTRRADGGTSTAQPGLIDRTLEVVMPHDPADTAFQAFRTAYTTRAVIGVAALNGPSSAGQGPLFDAHVTQFQDSQPIDDTSMVSVTFVPAPSANAASYTLSGV
jgi:hypothetical protein